MKNLRKLLTVVFTVALIFACSKNESVETAPKETIALEDGLDIDYEDLTVVTVDGEGDLDEEGGFHANTSSTTLEGLPVLFTKGEDVVFGYYSKTGANNKVSLDDILLFYYSINPEIGVQGLSNSALMSKIKSSPDYTKLKDLVSSSLQGSGMPLKNSEINDLIISSSQQILYDIRGYKLNGTKGGDEFEYKFSYTRDGKVEWEKEVPLFASVGIAIKDKNNNVVFGPEILKPKSLVLSPSSLMSYVYDTYFQSGAERIGSFSFQQEGDYVISYTNGSSPRNDILEDKTREENNNVLISQLVSLAVPVPKALKKVIKDAQCREAFKGLFQDIREIAAQQIVIGKTPTAGDMLKWVEDLSVNASNVSASCIKDVGWNSYFTTLLKFIDIFRKAETISELIFYSRDYFGSSVFGDESRYFYGGISFGYLKSEPISSRDFQGAEGSEHLYAANIKENVSTYKITRGVLESTWISSEEFTRADGLPFEANRVKGDASLVEQNPIVSFEGLFATFIMGKEDSEFEIKPTFLENSNQYGYTTDIVTLKPQVFNYEGTWLFKRYLLPEDVVDSIVRMNFDSNGNSTSTEVASPGTNWQYGPSSLTYTLSYNGVEKNLTYRSVEWGVSYVFEVDNIDDTLFHSTSNITDGSGRFELLRQ